MSSPTATVLLRTIASRLDLFSTIMAASAPYSSASVAAVADAVLGEAWLLLGGVGCIFCLAGPPSSSPSLRDISSAIREHLRTISGLLIALDIAWWKFRRSCPRAVHASRCGVDVVCLEVFVDEEHDEEVDGETQPSSQFVGEVDVVVLLSWLSPFVTDGRRPMT